MDLMSAKHDDTTNDDTFRKKLQDEIQKMMDCTSVIRPPMELSHLPHPLPPLKPDNVNLEKLEWIIPPIPVKPEDECRKEIYNGNIENRLD